MGLPQALPEASSGACPSQVVDFGAGVSILGQVVDFTELRLASPSLEPSQDFVPNNLCSTPASAKLLTPRQYQALTTFKRVSEDWNGRRYSSFS